MWLPLFLHVLFNMLLVEQSISSDLTLHVELWSAGLVGPFVWSRNHCSSWLGLMCCICCRISMSVKPKEEKLVCLLPKAEMILWWHHDEGVSSAHRVSFLLPAALCCIALWMKHRGNMGQNELSVQQQEFPSHQLSWRHPSTVGPP